MRAVKREYTTTTYTILESAEGKVSEVGKITLEGEENFAAARKKALKEYPERNVFIGDVHTETAVYTMDAAEFIKLAKKEVQGATEAQVTEQATTAGKKTK